MKKVLIKFISFMLATLTLIQTVAATSDNEEKQNVFENKTISILGDSICTFEGVSSGVAAETTNTTIKNNRDYYKNGKTDVLLEDTWWMQACQALGTKLLVNNSYSGTTIFSPFGDNEELGYLTRPYNLHDNTGNDAGTSPDIIAVYMGTNDISYHKSRLGSYSDIDYNLLITENNGKFNYKAPTTSAEAYAIMLHKIKTTYKNAEVYCFNILPREPETQGDLHLLKDFNESIKNIAEHFDCYVVDLYNECGLTTDKEVLERYLYDGYLHPNKKGMDAITNAFISALYKNSKYTSVEKAFNTVSYSLNDVIINEGTYSSIPAQAEFNCSFTKLKYGDLVVNVTMNGENITEACYENGFINIPAVTGDIEITASVKETARTFKSYRFEQYNGKFVNISTNENYSNALLTDNDSLITQSDIRLCYDIPWTLIFRTKNINGINDIISSINENDYTLTLDVNKSILGFKVNNSDELYGIDLSKQKLDYTQTHTFKIINSHSIKGENNFSLYIDNTYIGDFDSKFKNGAYDNNDISPIFEKDFVFNKFYSSSINNIVYLQIWENESRPNHKHSFDYPVTTQPTCVEYGATITTCDCGQTYSIPNIPPKGHTNGNWIMSKPATANEAGEAYKKCSICNEINETKAIPQLKCAKPKISALVNTEDGVKITWKAVDGADSYRVYHRQGNGAWKYLGTTNQRVFIDTSVKHGYWYSYTVRAVNEAGYSDYYAKDNKIQAFDTPYFKSVQNTDQGIKLNWNSIKGAHGYYIYKKIGNGEWKYLCWTKALTYTDKKVSNGTTYSYRVRAFRNDTISGYYLDGITAKRFSAPILKTPVNTEQGIKVQWNKLGGAAGYYVYRKTGNSGWKYIGKTTSTYFVDTKVQAGVTYKYTVKAYSSTGQFSAYSTKGISYERLTTPKIYDYDTPRGGIKIKWKDVKGADGYYVYRKTANSSWSYLGKTNSLNFTDVGAKKGTSYQYTVKAYSGSSVSSYNTKGINAKR